MEKLERIWYLYNIESFQKYVAEEEESRVLKEHKESGKFGSGGYVPYLW